VVEVSMILGGVSKILGKGSFYLELLAWGRLKCPQIIDWGHACIDKLVDESK